MTLLLMAIGLIFLVAGADLLVRGATRLALAAGLTPLIVGLTVVAYGTSAPELAVSLKAAWAGQADIAVGNVVGSNTFNVLLILGLSAAIVPLSASAQLIRLDVPIMIGVSAAAWGLAANGRIGRGEGSVLLLGALVYTLMLIWLGRQATTPAKSDDQPQAASQSGSARGLALAGVLGAIGLALLVLGSHWLVDGAVTIARWYGVNELVIGLTIVAAGTSLPEAATSVLAAIRGERDIAIGNIVGSNIFNLLAVLGGAATLSPSGISVDDVAIGFDFPVMLAVAVACLPIFFTGRRISRWEGALFLAYYCAYLAVLILEARGSETAATFGHAVLYFGLPMTVLGIVVSSTRPVT